MSGDRCRGLVKNANAVKSTVVVKTFRCPFTNAPPKLVSRKYFCANSQLTTSWADGASGQLSRLGSWESFRGVAGDSPSCSQAGGPGRNELGGCNDGKSIFLQLPLGGALFLA